MKIYNLTAPLNNSMIQLLNKETQYEKIIISCKNTKMLNSQTIKQLNDNIIIKITGGLDPKKNKFNYEDYQSRTLYSPKELSIILPVFEQIERKINPLWNALEKAIFVYKKLCEYLIYEETKINGRDASRNLLGLINGKSVCAGCAMIYKEAMDRIGVHCIYQNKRHSHSWNILEIDNKYYGIELTWEVFNKKNNQCSFSYFAKSNQKEFYLNYYHDISGELEEKEYPLEIIPDNIINETLKKIQNTQAKTLVYSLTQHRMININGYNIKVANNKLVCQAYQSMTYVRNDGSSFLILPSNKYLNGVFEYLYIEYNKDKNEIMVHRIYSEMNNLVTSDYELRDNIANNLLLRSRLNNKIINFNGYVGYIKKNSNQRYYNQNFEENILNVHR